MAHKKSCEGGCTCETADATVPVWVDPSSYSLVKHGPPYLKTASSRKLGALMEPGQSNLSFLVALLRAASVLHQSYHWLARRSYSDHLMFERIYNESQAGIDAVAEKYLGLGGDRSGLDPIKLSRQATQILEAVAVKTDNNVIDALRFERTVVLFLAEVITLMGPEATGGVQDLLQGLISEHETFIYLLNASEGL